MGALFFLKFILPKYRVQALAGVAQWTERKPLNQTVDGSIPSPARSSVRDTGEVSHTLMFLSLSFSLPLSEKKETKKG